MPPTLLNRLGFVDAGHETCQDVASREDPGLSGTTRSEAIERLFESQSSTALEIVESEGGNGTAEEGEGGAAS